MSKLKRTPENFPRMKHRAAKRIARKQAIVAMQQMPNIVEAVNKALLRMADQMSIFMDSFARELRKTPTQDDFALVAAGGTSPQSAED